jgi:hypothetical protein
VKRLKNLVAISFRGVEGESMLWDMNVNGIYIPHGFKIEFFNDNSEDKILELKGPYTISSPYPNLIMDKYDLKLDHTPDLILTNINELLNLKIKISKLEDKTEWVIKGTNNKYTDNNEERKFIVFYNESDFNIWYKNNIINKNINLQLADIQINNIIKKVERNTPIESINYILGFSIFNTTQTIDEQLSRFKALYYKENKKYDIESLNYLNELNKTNCDIIKKMIPWFNIKKLKTYNIDESELLSEIVSENLSAIFSIFIDNNIENIITKVKLLEYIPNNIPQEIINNISTNIKYGIGYCKLKYLQRFTEFEQYEQVYLNYILSYIQKEELIYDETENIVERYIPSNKNVIENLTIQEKNIKFGIDFEPFSIETVKDDNGNITIYE